MSRLDDALEATENAAAIVRREQVVREAQKLISQKREADYRAWKSPQETARDIANDEQLTRAQIIVNAKAHDDYINWRK